LARQGPGLIQGMQVETRTDPRDLTYHWISFRRGPREQGLERRRGIARRPHRRDAAALRPDG
jgi:5'-nucleotidase